jgi:hypothetical protein
MMRTFNCRPARSFAVVHHLLADAIISHGSNLLSRAAVLPLLAARALIQSIVRHASLPENGGLAFIPFLLLIFTFAIVDLVIVLASIELYIRIAVSVLSRTLAVIPISIVRALIQFLHARAVQYLGGRVALVLLLLDLALIPLLRAFAGILEVIARAVVPLLRALAFIPLTRLGACIVLLRRLAALNVLGAFAVVYLPIRRACVMLILRRAGLHLLLYNSALIVLGLGVALVPLVRYGAIRYLGSGHAVIDARAYGAFVETPGKLTHVLLVHALAEIVFQSLDAVLSLLHLGRVAAPFGDRRVEIARCA